MVLIYLKKFLKMLPGDSFGLVIAFAIGYDEVGVDGRSPFFTWSNASSSMLQKIGFLLWGGVYSGHWWMVFGSLSQETTSQWINNKKKTYHLTCPALGVDKGVKLGLCGGTAGFLKVRKKKLVQKFQIFKKCIMNECYMQVGQTKLKSHKKKQKKQTWNVHDLLVKPIFEQNSLSLILIFDLIGLM